MGLDLKESQTLLEALLAEDLFKVQRSIEIMESIIALG